MTLLMITTWLAMQLPAGIWLGRILQRGLPQAELAPVPVRRRPRR